MNKSMKRNQQSINKNVSIGSWITLNHFSIVEIMADAGFDWLCIDMEHSVIDYYDMELLIATIQSKGIKPFVRVGKNDDLIIKRVLDAGAEGIIVPMINSKDDAKKAINSVLYPPNGDRGVGLARAQNYGFNFSDYANKIIDEITLIVQIEHIEAIKNLSEILSLDGVDGSIIGPYDLSGSIGKPGQYEDDEVKSLLEDYEKISKTYDKPYGFHIILPDHKLLFEKIRAGYSFLGFSLDTIFLGTMARNEMDSIRKLIN